jgi:aspartyl aminopeptidase
VLAEGRSAAAPRSRADDYIGFLARAVTPMHAVVECASRLRAAGFKEKNLDDDLAVEPGERWWTVHPDGRTLVAVVVGERAPVDTGFVIYGAHTDSPDLRLRLNPLEEGAGTVVLTTQLHGGLVRRSWLDQPLGLAGAVWQAVRDRSGRPRFHPVSGQPLLARHLFHIDRPVAVIPSLALHLDREVNEKGAVDPQKGLNAVCASLMREDAVIEALSAEARVPLGEADGFDLHLFPWARPVRVGIDRSLVCGPRHDDLAMVWVGLEGLLASQARLPRTSHTRVAVFFDAEETGSQTSSGAASSWFERLLLRLVRRHPETRPESDAETALSRSLVVSGDMAHALHPSHREKHDPAHAPQINQGIVVKVNANDRYASTGETTAAFRAICEAAGVPMQVYLHRQDSTCGTTIGPITAARLGARVVDVGLPMWSMHSAIETLGAADLDHGIEALACFFTGAGKR